MSERSAAKGAEWIRVCSATTPGKLQHVREMGAEFAREFPKVAGRLGLDTFECADPYVERLLEGFAFLAGRVQLKLDAEFPSFTQHLLEIVYPHYLAPTPSMAIVQLSPNLSEGSLATGYKVPRGTTLRSLIGRGEQTACEYRTAHDVTLWPLEIVHAEYTGYTADLTDVRLSARPRAALRLKLRATAGLNISDLALEDLTLFLRGSDELPARLYEQLIGHAIGIVARPATHAPAWRHVVSERPTAAVGFDDEQALLPYGPRSFQGYRLLQEYFACPSRFLFVQLRDLAPAVRRCTSSEIEILVLMDSHDASLDGAVDDANLTLHATPIVNLFSRRADRIHVTEAVNEYHVVPDRTRPMDLEVYGISEVVGVGATAETNQVFRPFYAWNDHDRQDEAAAYYTIQRQPRTLSTKQRSQGARSSYVGSEVFVSLVDADEGPYRSSAPPVGDRDPVHEPGPLVAPHARPGTNRLQPRVRGARRLHPHRRWTDAPASVHAHGETSWRLISHLSLNYLSLVDSRSGLGRRRRRVRESCCRSMRTSAIRTPASRSRA